MKNLMTCLLAIFALQVSAQSTPEKLRFTSTAKTTTGEVAYQEIYEVTFNEEGLARLVETQYLDANGKTIATIKSDFSKNPFVPESEFRDLRHDIFEQSKIEGDEVILTRERGKNKKSARLKLKPDSILGQGHYNFVLKNFKELTSSVGKSYDIDFIVPSELDRFSFTLEVKAVTDERLRLSLAPASWFVSVFLNPIIIEYDFKKRLQLFDGLSNIPDESGKRRERKITFKYDD